MSACNAGDLGLIPGSGKSPGEGNGNLLQYSCLENPMDRGAWRATVHRVAKSQTRLSDFTHKGWLRGKKKKKLSPGGIVNAGSRNLHGFCVLAAGTEKKSIAIVNRAAMNTGVRVSLSVLLSSLCMPSSGTAGLYTHS